MTHLSPGDRFGPYVVEASLGAGGMGVVHIANDTRLHRRVAVKVISNVLAADPEFMMRFQREAEALARVDSPHIVSIFEHGEHDGAPFIATQYVAGGDLRSVISARGALTPGATRTLGIQLAEALADAHRAGVVHRDVKPANILVRDPEAVEPFFYLCDFGIAQTDAERLTQTGGIAGSLEYLAPERFEGDPGTPASDLYALGCVLYACLTGHPPYRGSFMQLARAHAEAPIPKLDTTDPLAAHIDGLISWCLAKAPSARPLSATDLRAALGRLPLVKPVEHRLPLAGTAGAAPPPQADVTISPSIPTMPMDPSAAPTEAALPRTVANTKVGFETRTDHQQVIAGSPPTTTMRRRPFRIVVASCVIAVAAAIGAYFAFDDGPDGSSDGDGSTSAKESSTAGDRLGRTQVDSSSEGLSTRESLELALREAAAPLFGRLPPIERMDTWGTARNNLGPDGFPRLMRPGDDPDLATLWQFEGREGGSSMLFEYWFFAPDETYWEGDCSDSTVASCETFETDEGLHGVDAWYYGRDGQSAHLVQVADRRGRWHAQAYETGIEGETLESIQENAMWATAEMRAAVGDPQLLSTPPSAEGRLPSFWACRFPDAEQPDDCPRWVQPNDGLVLD